MKKFKLSDAKLIGDKLNIDWNEVDINQFVDGLNVELEHGTKYPDYNVTDNDPIKTAKIALAHLKEIKDYYTRLNKMEKEGGVDK